MSNIIIAKEVPDSIPSWRFGDQVVRHNVDKGVDPRLQKIGFNQYGAPEGIFTYGRDATTAKDFVVDIDVAPRHDKLTGRTEPVVLGIHLMCPRCLQPLYIRTADSPSGVGRPAHLIEVHWHRRRTAQDGYWRPTFSVGGPIKCENTWRTSKVAQPDTPGLCNWRGGIINGKAHDHFG